MEASAEATPSSPEQKGSNGGAIRRAFDAILVPVLAVFTALVIGGIIIVVTDASVYAAFREGGIGAGLSTAWSAMFLAYSALYSGSPLVKVWWPQRLLFLPD